MLNFDAWFKTNFEYRVRLLRIFGYTFDDLARDGGSEFEFEFEAQALYILPLLCLSARTFWRGGGEDYIVLLGKALQWA